MPLDAVQRNLVRDLVYRRSAILLDQTKDYLIDSRLEPLIQELGYKDASELVDRARVPNAPVATKIVEALTTHESTFFRDVSPFEILKKVLIPQFAKSRAPSKTLAIWSAACSTGQEPYSIAMVFQDQFPEMMAWPPKILATDLSSAIIESAKTGRFRQMEMNRGLPAAMMVKYFDRVGTEWQIKPALRAIVDFKQLNLLDQWVLWPRPDIVFLRNVLIYFDVSTKRSILDRLSKLIAPDGALFLGSTETTLGVSETWEPVLVNNATYYRPRS